MQPIENNPDVLNQYLRTLGLKDCQLEFTDVFGVSPDLIAMVPRPVKAFLFVFPVSAKTETQAADLVKHQEEEVKAFRKEHQVFYTKQFVMNECGTVAFLHALLNNKELLGTVPKESLLSRFCDKIKGSEDPKEIGKRLQEAEEITKAHDAISAEGTTAQLGEGAKVNLHFVCFVQVGDRCIELDGRQADIMLHGPPCKDNEDFIQCAADAIQEKMKLDPASYEYSITALIQTTPN